MTLRECRFTSSIPWWARTLAALALAVDNLRHRRAEQRESDAAPAVDMEARGWVEARTLEQR